MNVLLGCNKNSVVRLGSYIQKWPSCALSTSNPLWVKKLRSTLSEKQERFMRKKELKKAASLKVVKVWNGITPAMMANNIQSTLKSQITADDVLELVLDAGGDVNDEHTPINDMKLLNRVTTRLGIRVSNIRNPAMETIESLTTRDKIDASPSKVMKDKLKPRPPVVAIMGHVDHGKTTLLDYLRKSNVVQGEAGGITQHIGAFVVDVGQVSPSISTSHITFIDTPGHAAFRSMRERGAEVTDLAVLVVSATEGVLPQTVESVRMIRSAPKCSMVVAINKIDIATLDQIEATKNELYTKAGILSEEMGGDTQTVTISAKKGLNMEQLIEAIATQAEVLELQAEVDGVAVEGVILESRVEKGLGKTATVLIKRGTIRKGQFLVCEDQWCRIRVMQDDKGANIEKAGPSHPVRVSGWRDEQLPHVGATVLEVESERRAQEVVRYRRLKLAKQRSTAMAAVIDEQRQEEKESQQVLKRRLIEMGGAKFSQGIVKSPLAKEIEKERLQMSNRTPKVSYIVKADVDGSLEAIMDCLNTYEYDNEVILDLVNKGVGEVNTSDVEMAVSFDATIYAFNVQVSSTILKLALDLGVTIRQQQVIYQLIEELKESLSAKLPPLKVDDINSVALVQKEFALKTSSKTKKPPIVAGCLLERGTLEKQSKCKVIRGNEVLHVGKIVSLRHLKDEVDKLEQGRECGIIVDEPELRYQPGDKIVSYSERYEKQYTKWNPGF